MSQESFEAEIADFVAQWHSDSTEMLVHTSGSTGKPKPFWAQKDKMANSARMTCQFLGLAEGDTALLCMPMRYIAGKMVVVRSIVGKLRLVAIEPTGHPMQMLSEPPVFAALTPMQVFNSLSSDAERQMLMGIKHLIIGGGAIDGAMAEQLRCFGNNVWSTYGMTETLSHIAMRRLSGPDASLWYQPMDGVNVSLSARGTLVIDAPHVADGTLETNDIAEIDDRGRFRILGRTDNTINSGGIKIQAEEVERLLNPHLRKPFIITAVPDSKFGEAMTLLTEDTDIAAVAATCQQTLPRHWQPKHIVACAVPLTETHKPDRAAAKRIATQRLDL